jgi:TonB family protein
VTNPAPESTVNQAVENSPTQPSASTATPAPSPSLSANVDPTSTLVKEKESAQPLVKQPDVPMSVTWSVAVSTDPYPSIRIPPDLSSQKASGGRSLQIGRAISRVEPVYPEEAKRQSMEGIVKLRVVVGRDGSVQSVETTSGPALLGKAAANAVREWRYAQTLLGGQPVETEQDIVVRFRLMNLTGSKD